MDKEKLDANKVGFWLPVGTMVTVIFGVIVGTIYFVVFIYQMRDAISDNIRENSKNQAILFKKQDESIDVQKQIACLLKFHVYEQERPYKGECDNRYVN